MKSGVHGRRLTPWDDPSKAVELPQNTPGSSEVMLRICRVTVLDLWIYGPGTHYTVHSWIIWLLFPRWLAHHSSVLDLSQYDPSPFTVRPWSYHKRPWSYDGTALDLLLYGSVLIAVDAQLKGLSVRFRQF